MQGPKSGVPVSIEHLTAAPASPAWKAKVGVASLVRPAGPESIPTAGGVVSTVQPNSAGAAVGVAGGVHGADFEAVGALGEGAVGLGARSSRDEEPAVALRHS